MNHVQGERKSEINSTQVFFKLSIHMCPEYERYTMFMFKIYAFDSAVSVLIHSCFLIALHHFRSITVNREQK